MSICESYIKRVLKEHKKLEKENNICIFHECKFPEYAKEEVWQSIVGTENFYISSFGRILRKNKSDDEVKLLTETETYKKTGKVMINGSFVRPHILTAKYFGALGSGEKVIHINGDKDDNIVDNLRFVSKQEASRAPVISREFTTQVPLLQFSPTGIFIRCWENVSEVVQETSFRAGDVLSCAEGKVLTAHGCIWTFHTNDPRYRKFPDVERKAAALKQFLIIGFHDGIFYPFPTVGEASQTSGLSEFEVIRRCMLMEVNDDWIFAYNGKTVST